MNFHKIEKSLDRVIDAIEKSDPTSETFGTLVRHYANLLEVYRTSLYTESDKAAILESLSPEGDEPEKEESAAKIIPMPTPSYPAEDSEEYEGEPEEPAEPDNPDEPDEPESTYTLAEVRSYLAKARSDYGVDVSAIIKDLGYSQLSQVPASKYADLIKASGV